MNTRHAWGFLSLGLVMGLVPMVAPAWFPPSGMDGSSTRALWLELMGLVQTVLGGGRVTWHLAAPAIVRWLAVAPAPRAAVVPFAPAADRPLPAAGLEEAEAA
jgi:hypothetical protein